MNPPPLQKPIACLGGGQLSRMLLEAAHRRGIPFLPVCSSETDPAALLARALGTPFEVGDLAAPATYRALFEKTQFLLFESEFIDLNPIDQAITASLPVEFFPARQAIQTLRDKLSQKRLFRKLALPSAPFLENPSPADALRRFSEGAVLKWARGGYDGKGVFVLPASADAETLGRAKAFLETARKNGSDSYAEALVPFERELACAYARERSGKLHAFPLVLSEQERGVCRLVRGPAVLLGVDPRLETEARRIAETLSRDMNLQGVFAVEFFLTREGKLLVNEIAPRVHNSAHVTQELPLSQFEAHLLCAKGLPLPPIETPRALYAMWNVLGPETLPPEGVSPPETLPPPPQDARLHWYEKALLTPRRKLGHLNTSGARDAAELDSRVARMKEWEKRLFP